MTREEMALIAVRTAEKQGEKAGTLVDNSMLKDYSTIGSYYKDYALKAFSMVSSCRDMNSASSFISGVFSLH